jgi:hypothetical protein
MFEERGEKRIYPKQPRSLEEIKIPPPHPQKRKILIIFPTHINYFPEGSIFSLVLRNPNCHTTPSSPRSLSQNSTS